MWKRVKEWFDKYDLVAIVLMTLALALVSGAIVGSIITNRYDYEFNVLKERFEIMQEHIVECVDDTICEHYKFE